MSARKLLAVFRDRDGNWVATIKQGCMLERHTLLRRGLSPYDDIDLEEEMWERARKLV